jgi:hypothetical protein
LSENWIFNNEKLTLFSNWKRGGFGIPSGFLCTSFGSSSGAPEGFRRDSRRIPEENNKKTGNKYESDKNACMIPGRYH